MRQPQQDWIAKWAVYSPDKIAVKEYESGRTFTYGELHHLGSRLAFHLRDHYGIKKGSRIAILAENCLEYIVLFAAAQKMGCILAPMNYRLASAEIDYLLRDSEPALAICEKKFAPLFQGAPSFASIPHYWPLEELSAFCHREKASHKDELFPLQPVDEDDPIFILYTSGTTGFPKGAVYTHKMLFWNSINTAMSLILNTDSRTVNVMPPFHTGGWNVLTTPFLHHGAYTCMLKKFDASTVLRLLQEEDVTLFMGVPTLLKMMAEVPEFGEATFPSLYYIIVGGEPMPIPLIERWQYAKGVAIRQGFGMTEVGPNLTSLHQNDAIRKKGSIGRPNFYVEIRIVDSEGKDVPEDTAGELLFRGPMVTPGYWRNEAATRKAIVDGWFHTGDMARLDEEGYLFVVDRIKNMFISGGENVYPAEVERVLQTHASVSEAAVVGVPDARWGEVGKAFVVLRPGVVASEADLQDYCSSLLARFKVPRYVIFVEELPKNDTGKINRAALKQLA
ncbi:MAG: long-chain fatty acid--CoA ligase [Lewinellaceae bacterium]|nr:long-chain fatty acid--CoA ligase [Phaeodactylibacter sp.]MCB0613324.1 long-chain fatty acid--CoA ligase [Phaeodactylibacter sp.]MCB9351843.1 long-chain fatty acid--CoA ligase [Lewinellaceae bacterium]